MKCFELFKVEKTSKIKDNTEDYKKLILNGKIVIQKENNVDQDVEGYVTLKINKE